MGLLKSIKGVPGIDYYEYRDNDYYNKFVYRARFNIEGVYYTWFAKSREQFLRDISKHRSPAAKKALISNQNQLTQFVDFRFKFKELNNHMIRIEGDNVSVFSNDLQFLKDIPKFVHGITVDYTECIKSAFVGVKQFVKEPKHKYRVYLKSKRIEKEWAQSLMDLFKKMPNLHPSSALKFWANNVITHANPWKYRWTSASHFIDYDDESTLSYLALVHGEFLGKRYKLENRPD